MLNLNMVNTCIANSFVESFLYIGCGHRGEQLPSDDVSGKIIQNRVLIILIVTLVACCVTKCQEVPIRLAQIWHSIF